MSAHDFLRLILPSHGFYIGFARKGEARRQWVLPSLDDLITCLMEASSKDFDTYHACSTFRDQRGVWVENKGKVEFRCRQNILFVKSLWLDVDTQEGKQNAKYRDCQEAYEDSLRFCREAELPKPCYVGSGRGLHLYWPLDEEMELGEWEVHARLLKAACVRLGFSADPARTADASSILRTPGTKHQASGRLVEHGNLLGRYRRPEFDGLREFESANGTRRPSIRLSSTLSQAVANVYGPPDSDPQIVTSHCQQLQAFAQNPENYSEPFHYSVAGLFVYCAEGLDYFTSLLDEEWREVGRQKAAQWQASATGPTSCRRFEEINPGGCGGCPYKGEITSPIILGQGYTKQTEKRKNVGAAPVLNGYHIDLLDPILSEINLPDLWKFSDAGQLVWQEDTPKGIIDTIVSEYPIFLDSIHSGEGNGVSYYSFRHFLPNESWHTVNLPAATIFGPALVSSMAALGAHVRDGKLFTRYCHDSVDAWHHVNKMNSCYGQCGWKEDNNAFLIGLQLHRPGGYVKEVVGDNDVQERGKHLRLTMGGSVRGWCSAINKLTAEKREAVNFAILCGFAAPLMRFQTKDEGGTIVSLVNRSSGTGKSTTLDMVASIWGQKDGCSVEARDTAVGKGLLMACLGNLPVCFDEMASIYKQKTPEALKEFIELFSQGRDKIRAKQHGQGLQHTPGRWQTILLTASNLSIVDLLESTDRRGVDAPAYRVVELRVDYPRHLDYFMGDQLKFELFENAGHAGPAFIQHILEPKVYDFVQKALKQWTNEIWKVGQFKQEHRFWVRLLGACAVAGEVCRGIGLLQIDPHETIAWVIERLGVRGETKTVAGNESVEALGEYLNDRLRDMLVVSGSWSPGDRPSIPERTPLGKLLIRFEMQTGRLCVQQRDFKLWLVERGYPYSETLAQLADTRVLTEKIRRTTLSAGTNLVSAPVICTEFDMKHPSVSGIVREVKSKLEAVK